MTLGIIIVGLAYSYSVAMSNPFNKESASGIENFAFLIRLACGLME